MTLMITGAVSGVSRAVHTVGLAHMKPPLSKLFRLRQLPWGEVRALDDAFMDIALL